MEIICGLATTLDRKLGLEISVKSIINQVDKLIVYQNGYKEIFDFLNDDKIEVISSIDTGFDLGDIGKFYRVSEFKNNYYFSIDDDIEYPANYVENTINNLKNYGGNVIVCYHGRILKENAKSYYTDYEKIFYFFSNNPIDKFVQFGGTGVMAFDTRKVKFGTELFKTKNMSDIWVGKYAQENKIPILCLKHKGDWLKEIKLKTDSIFNRYSKKDFGQNSLITNFDKTKILNFNLLDSKVQELRNKISTENVQLSIIVPTYNNIQYIDETLNSIINSGKNHNIEILIGIDGCTKTLDHINNKVYPDFVKFYYFEDNNGPYTIKNSLVKISNSDSLLFFDSDDVMLGTTITEIVNNIVKYDMVKLKYNEIFNDKIKEHKQRFHEGNFAIKKSIFLSMNGFEPWMCAADSDFLGRFYKKRPRIYHTNKLSVLYRRHNTSLTMKKETGMTSSLRGSYARISKNKKGDGNPNKLHTRDFFLVDVNTIVIDKKINNEYYDSKKPILNKVLNPVPRKVVSNVTKKSDPVIKDRLEMLCNTEKPLVRTIIPNKPDNRQELINLKNNTNKSVYKQLFKTKPERRTGINPITLGGKPKN